MPWQWAHCLDAHADQDAILARCQDLHRLRNAIMRAKSPENWYDIVDWLYGSTGLEGALSAETHRR